MKKTALLIIMALVVAFGAYFITNRKQSTPQKNGITIGIIQTASHPALDAVRDGFMITIKRSMPQVSFVIRNGQGSLDQLHAMAQQLHADDTIDIFFAIATPAVQAMATAEQKRPVIIAAVTDPDALNIITSNTNITGVSDMIDIPKQIHLVTSLLPTAKTIGILYNNGETNSRAAVAHMKHELDKYNVTYHDIAISNESDLPAAIDMAFTRYDAVIAPTDNMVAASACYIASIAKKHLKPFIVSDNTLVTLGALAAHGIDYHQHGAQAAEITADIALENKKPFEVPITATPCYTSYINKTTMNLLGLTVPASLQDQTIFVP